MTWVKLSDTFAEDPRLEDAGPLALALHVAALCYCARQLTDGAIPRRTVRRLLDLDDPESIVKRLVGVELWAETPDGYAIFDYLRDQPSREHVEQVRAKRAASGRAGGRASGASRRSKSEAMPKQSARRVVEHPAPTRPDPDNSSARETDRPDAAELEKVLTDGLPAELAPDRDGRTRCGRHLAAVGWTADDLRLWLQRQSWTGVRGPGLVMSKVAQLGPDDRPRRPRARTPSGPSCSNGIRLAADGTCCAEHAAEAAS